MKSRTKPTPMLLAQLAATLEANRQPEDFRQETVAVNLARCEPQVSEARRLWDTCNCLFKQTPMQERRGLSVDELAMLGAELAHGQPMREIDLRIVATRALELWQECKKRLTPSPEFHKAFQDALAAEERERPKSVPTKFPVALKAATKWWLPQKRWPDRSRLFRHYLRDGFRLIVPSDAENGFFVPTERSEEDCERLGDAEFDRTMRQRLTELEYYHHRKELPRWVKAHEARSRSEKSAKGGKP